MRVPATVLAILTASAARADPVDLVDELGAIGTKAIGKEPRRWVPVAGPGCTPLTKAERTALTRRVTSWLDTQHPDQKASVPDTVDELALVLAIGCKEPDGVVPVAVAQDRAFKKVPPDTARATRQNYVLRVSPSAIDVVIYRPSTPSGWWMEWADQGGYDLVGQIDIDGDGALDLVYSEHEHEGGSINSYDTLVVRRALGAVVRTATVANMNDVRLVGGQLVVAGGEGDEAGHHYGCLGSDFFVRICPAAAGPQRAADVREIAQRYGGMSSADVPDKELLAAELTTLGITGKKQKALVAAAPDTTPQQRAQRAVAAFLAKAGLDDKLQPALQQAHPDARAYLDGVATKLGDLPCAQTPLTDADRAAVTAWVKKQDAKAGADIAPATCGRYAWAAWTPKDGGMRREVLLALDGTIRILGFTFDDMMMPGWVPFRHDEAFFVHDGTIVGTVIHEQNLWVVADGKVVAQSKGSVGRYRYDRRWSETATNLVLDGGTIWHATPTGREKLDPKAIDDREQKRKALERVLDNPASNEPAYIAALATLGADAKLVALCKLLK